MVPKQVTWWCLGLVWELVHASGAAALDQEPRSPGDEAPQDVAERAMFVEVDAPEGPVFVQQAVRVCLRIGVDREFLESRAIQPFRKALDLPIRIEAPWLPQPENTTLLARSSDDGTAAKRSLVLNHELANVAAAADRVVDGRTFAMVEMYVRFASQGAGTIQLEAPASHVLHATRFREDLVGGRVPEDRHEWTARGPRREIVVVDLPAPAPDEFSSAVGRFTLMTQAEPTTMQSGQIFELRLSVEGDGNLTTLVPPDLSRLDGFHVYGKAEVAAAAGRTFTYDLASLRSSVTEFPSISLCYFDVDDRNYRTIRSAPIPLRVRPGPEEAAPLQEFATPVNRDQGSDESTRAASDGALSDGGWPRWQVVFPVLGTCGALAILWFARRRRSIAPKADPSLSRSDALLQAAEQLRARIDQPDCKPVDLLADFLAVMLDCPAPAVIGPSLAQRLERVGLDAALASNSERLLDSLLAARYGGPRTVDPKEVRMFVEMITRQSRAP